MKKLGLLFIFCALVYFAYLPLSHATIVEVGDLNIIDDAGNSSDGLRFLDTTYSLGLTQAAALLNAQSVYANARLATASEWDDLFSAAGIEFDATLTAADAFSTGANTFISTAFNYDAGNLVQVLGESDSRGWLRIFSTPDGNSHGATTRDSILLTTEYAFLWNENISVSHGAYGWLIVSDASASIPIPSAGWLFISAIAGLASKKRLTR